MTLIVEPAIKLAVITKGAAKALVNVRLRSRTAAASASIQRPTRATVEAVLQVAMSTKHVFGASALTTATLG